MTWRGMAAVLRAWRMVQRAWRLGPATDSPVPGHLATRAKAVDGMAWIEAGCVEVVDPVGEGNLAAIVAGPGIALEVNGQPCRSAAVRKGDTVRLSPAEPVLTVPSTYEVAIAPDRLSATLTVTPGSTVTRSIPDHPRSVRLEVRVVEEVRIHPPAVAEALRALDEAGVVWGIRRDRLDALAHVRERTSIVVAEGLQPGAGRAPGFTPFLPGVDLNARRRHGVPVQAGWLLGQLLAGHPGTPGHTVTGDEIPADTAFGHTWTLGRGLRLEEDRLYAQVDGRFVLRDSQEGPWCDVIPLRLIPEVLEGQHVAVTDSDVFIHGHLTRVRADIGGALFVSGSVSDSDIRTWGDLWISDGVTRSCLLSGERSLLAAVFPHLAVLRRDLGTILDSYQRVRHMRSAEDEDWARRGLRSVIKVLLRKRLGHVPDVLARLHRLVGHAESVTGRMVRSLEDIFLGADGGGALPTNLGELGRDIDEVLNRIRELDAGQSMLVAQVLSNAELACDGDVALKRGAENSYITALGNIVCGGPIRASEVWATGDIMAPTIGSPYETNTKITSVSGRIYAQQVHPGVTFEIGGEVLVNEVSRRDCVVLLEDHGLVMTSVDVMSMIEQKTAVIDEWTWEEVSNEGSK